MRVDFGGNLKFIVIVCYSLINVFIEVDVIQFYYELKDMIDVVLVYNVFIVLGDFNV